MCSSPGLSGRAHVGSRCWQTEGVRTGVPGLGKHQGRALDVQIVGLEVAGWGEVETAHFTWNLGYREASIDIW